MGTERIEAIPQGTKGHCRWCGKPVPKGRRSWCGPECVHEGRIRSDPGYVRSCVWKRDNGVCAGCGLITSQLDAMAGRAILQAAILEPHTHEIAAHHSFRGEAEAWEGFVVRGGVDRQEMGRIFWLPGNAHYLGQCLRVDRLWDWQKGDPKTGQWAVLSGRHHYRCPGLRRLVEAVPHAFLAHARVSLLEVNRCECGYCQFARYHRYEPGKHTWEADHIVPVVEGGGGCGLDNYRTLCLRCHTAESRKLAARRAAMRTLAKAAAADGEADRRRSGAAPGQTRLFK